MDEIIKVDFQNKKVISRTLIEHKEPKLDPVLELVKQQMSPNDFEVFKKSVDHWQEANFVYEFEKRNKKT